MRERFDYHLYMRHALILAGGSGLRLWPMSRAGLPKQLIPFIKGRSLLEIAVARAEGLTPAPNRWICAAESQREMIGRALSGWPEGQFLGEPVGRDTLNAIGLGAAVIAAHDPEAVIAVFTADHLIEPVARFREIVRAGYELVERDARTLVTFGIAPTGPATGYGYLELGEPFPNSAARVVRQFREKPGAAAAREYFEAGPECYLWNSGMFVWNAATLLDCISRYEPETAAALTRVAAAWDTPRRAAVLQAVYPGLKKISVDYAVMEPASRDESVRVAAVPMPLDWLDVGSWPAFAKACPTDKRGNAVAAERVIFEDSSSNLVASSDPKHLIAVLGCEDLIVVHTPEATLICRSEYGESIKELHKLVAERFGGEYL